MTVDRRYGNEQTENLGWARSRSDIDSLRDAITINDVDFTLTKYMQINDAVGDRRVKLMMEVEEKSDARMPNASQLETLFMKHQRLVGMGPLKIPGSREPVTCWHFGVHIIVFSHQGPLSSSAMRWCSFDENGGLFQEPILSLDELADIYAFRVRVDKPRMKNGRLQPLSIRRHHTSKTEMKVEEKVIEPLNFENRRIHTISWRS